MRPEESVRAARTCPTRDMDALWLELLAGVAAAASTLLAPFISTVIGDRRSHGRHSCDRDVTSAQDVGVSLSSVLGVHFRDIVGSGGPD
jgi:hypothetical protein